jgi:hypothetical protein
MNFDFTYDGETEEINIIYDNQLALKAFMENNRCVFQNFSKIEDENVEALLKNLCKQTFHIFT